MTKEQLVDATGIETSDLNLPVKKLLEEKVISRKGNKRATVYSVKVAKK